jgi:hypothetical protein
MQAERLEYRRDEGRRVWVVTTHDGVVADVPFDRVADNNPQAGNGALVVQMAINAERLARRSINPVLSSYDPFE